MRQFDLHTVNGCVQAVWDAEPEKEAMVFYDDKSLRYSWSNRDVAILSERLASFMFHQGVKRGDVVCNMMSDSVEREIVNIGILLAGAVVMPWRAEETLIRRRQSDDSFQDDIGAEIDGSIYEVIKRGNVKFLVVSTDASIGWELVKHDVGFTDADVEIMTRSEKLLPTVKKTFKFNTEHQVKEKQFCQRAQGKTVTKSLFDVILEHQGTLRETVSESTTACFLIDRDPAELHYRIVRRSHSDVVHECMRQVEMLGWTSDDIFFHKQPPWTTPRLMYHYILLGCTSVFVSKPDCSFWRNVQYIWWVLGKEHVTVAEFSPQELQILKTYCEDLKEPHYTLRTVITDGSDVRQMSQSLMDAIGACTQTIAVTYSRIEAGLVSRLIVDSGNETTYARGCVGQLTAQGAGFVDLDVLHVNKGAMVGEILLSSQLMSREYIGDTDLTAASYTNDGRLRTKDIGCFDDQNRLYIMGRDCDVILRGRHLIKVWEIEENIIEDCQGLLRVKVVPVIDDRGRTKVCACVIPRKNDRMTLESIEEFCKDYLDSGASSELPDYVLLMGALPIQHEVHYDFYLMSLRAQKAINGQVDDESGDELLTPSKPFGNFFKEDGESTKTSGEFGSSASIQKKLALFE